ncbi:MAG: alpha/beta fold hydrolase [Microthrixaceae bacterium]
MGNESNGHPDTQTVALHGFTQNHRCLGPITEHLAERSTVTAVDLPGHGTATELAALDCPASADHLAARCGVGHWFGYSLGGRVALHVALQHPEVVESLVVLGATPGIADPSERERRRRLDSERASMLTALGVEEFCRQWLEMPLFEHLPQWAYFMEERGSNTVEGLSGSLLNAGTGSMEPLWERLGEIEMPVLVLAGDLDAKFCETASALVEAIGTNATFAAVPGTGHAAHLESPERTAAIIGAFRDRLGS